MSHNEETYSSQQDFSWLDDLLSNRIIDDTDTQGKDEGILDLSELDGFFTAIVSGPEMIPPSLWLPKVWGDYEPDWESTNDLQKAVGIMVTIMNSIIDGLMDSGHSKPLFTILKSEGKDILIVEEWCFGYMRGVDTSSVSWETSNEVIKKLLEPIVLFGRYKGFKILDKMTEAEIESMKAKITSSVNQIHSHFLKQRQSLRPTTDPTHKNKISIAPLPTYTQQQLAEQSNQKLIDQMVKDEDRVPRNVIDESVKRGDSMAQTLEQQSLLEGHHELSNGQWWMQLHAINILGLMEGEIAGQALLKYFDKIEEDREDSLMDWISGYYPALSNNKTSHFFNQLKDRCLRKTLSPYVKADYAQALVAHAQQQGEQPFEEMLNWVVERIQDMDEEEEYRLMLAASILLDIPQQRYRPLLEQLADQQSGMGIHFNRNDIELCYDEKPNSPDWERFSDPWSFYTPKEITQRQERWAEEGRINNSDEIFTIPTGSNLSNYNIVETFIRDTPKISRNDPCLCGSGKKYKKCCLH